MRAGKKSFLIITSILIGCTLALLIAEIVTRIINPATNSLPTIYDYEIGVRLQPGYIGICNKEGLSHFSINSEGWRDIERSAKKSKGIFRIAVVGDSYIEALQVERDKMFSSQLENMLNSGSPKAAYEVIPFGISGFDTAQAYLTIVHKIIKYQPDLIIYAFVSGNDLRDGVREIADYPWKPYFIFKNGNLTLDDSYKKFIFDKESNWRRPLVLFLRKNSKFIEYLMYVTYPRLKTIWAMEEENSVNLNERGLSSIKHIYRRPTENELYYKAWAITECLILKMAEFARANNSRFMVFGVDNSNQVDSPKPLPAGYDLYYPEHRLTKFAADKGLYYLPLAQDFANINKEAGVIFHGSKEHPGGHWNETGHYYAALKVCEYLKTKPDLLCPLND